MLNKISLTNFRNIAKLELVLSPKVTIIVGDNAQGKTNLVEAIYYLTKPSSERASKEEEVVGPLSNYCRIGGEVHGDDKKINKPSVYIQKETEGRIKKDCRVNNIKVSTAKFSGTIPSFLFSPADMTILLGAPRRRRRQLDSALPLFVADYSRNVRKYDLILKNRNKLLLVAKTRRIEYEELDYWDNELIDFGHRIIHDRMHFLESINPLLLQTGKLLLDEASSLKIQYLPSPAQKSSASKNEIYNSFKTNLERLRSKELAYEKTLIGPQKDEWRMIKIKPWGESEDLGYFGSRGQQRLGILAWKLAQIMLFNQTFKEKSPLLLLDDPFSELDAAHQHHLINVIKSHQTVITTTDSRIIPKSLKASLTYRVVAGTFTKEP